MKNEFHLWLNANYDKSNTTHTYPETDSLIQKSTSIIHTTQLSCVSTSLFEKNYRIFVHCEDNSVFELTLGTCERTSREIRMGHCLSKLIINGGFEGVLNEQN